MTKQISARCSPIALGIPSSPMEGLYQTRARSILPNVLTERTSYLPPTSASIRHICCTSAVYQDDALNGFAVRNIHGGRSVWDLCQAGRRTGEA
jgi:hypothetical protein